MSALYLLLVVSLVLFIWGLVSIRPDTRNADEVLCCIEKSDSWENEPDLLAVELGARIFSSEDSRAVGSETWRDFARWFRSERKILALDWLREVRGHVRKIIREHRRAARQHPDADPIQELRLALRFFLFELTSGILYGLVWMRGPDDLARAVELFLEAAAKLRKAAERALPPTDSATRPART